MISSVAEILAKSEKKRKKSARKTSSLFLLYFYKVKISRFLLHKSQTCFKSAEKGEEDIIMIK